MATGRSSSVYSAYSRVRSIPRTSPSELTISVTTWPHPPRRFTSRRKAVSVMPAIGASANGCSRSIRPILRVIGSVGLDVRGVHFHADRLSDQVDRQHQPRVRTLSHQPPDHALQRPMDDLDHHPFANQRTGIELQI